MMAGKIELQTLKRQVTCFLSKGGLLFVFFLLVTSISRPHDQTLKVEQMKVIIAYGVITLKPHLP